MPKVPGWQEVVGLIELQGLMYSILLVEDEPDQAELIAFSLRKANFTVDIAYTAAQALEKLSASVPCLAVIDRRLPDADGVDLCEKISKTYAIPTLILTAFSSSDQEVVNALSRGAQDYLQKSHSHRELIARINTLLKSHQALTKTIRLDSSVLHIDLSRNKCYVGASELLLTVTEWKLLLCLVNKLGVIVDQKDLYREVWRVDIPDSDVIKTNICRLRRKLCQAGCSGDVIAAVKGQGYILHAIPPLITSSVAATATGVPSYFLSFRRHVA
ncbi:MAG: response regulator transcription factor [Candidatus Melainabacteria bacterium]|nr:response regulator transcription factor [Candidatus Melainabacteria bacterium]